MKFLEQTLTLEMVFFFVPDSWVKRGKGQAKSEARETRNVEIVTGRDWRARGGTPES